LIMKSKRVRENTKSLIFVNISVSRKARHVATVEIDGGVRVEIASSNCKWAEFWEDVSEVMDNALRGNHTLHLASGYFSVAHGQLPIIGGELDVVCSCIEAELLKRVGFGKAFVDLEDLADGFLEFHLLIFFDIGGIDHGRQCGAAVAGV